MMRYDKKDMTTEYTLLPSGFHDLLPPLAAEESRVVQHLNSFYAQFGYQQIKPPMVEFDSSQSDAAHSSMEGESFKVMDSISQRMMKIRSDITLQASRIADLRLRTESRPLRLSYAGQVLRVKGQGLNAERQLSQNGVELIGVDSIIADVEIMRLALESVSSLGVESLSIDMTIPALSHEILEHYQTPDALKNAILEYIENKDVSSLKAINDPSVAVFLQLLSYAGNAEKLLSDFDTSILTDKLNEKINRLIETAELFKKTHADIAITFDLLERRGFEYHTALGFSLFSTLNQEELGRGGRYRTQGLEHAVGFSLNVNALLRACPSSKERPSILVASDASSQDIEMLQSRGYITVYHVADGELREVAQQLGYGYAFIEGKIALI